MNVLKFVKVTVGLAVAGLALGGGMVLSASCAGDSKTGGTGGNAGGNPGDNTGGNAGGAAGSSAVACTPSDNDVCIKEGSALGAMKGVGWVALGELDKLDDPTCDTDKHAITSKNACTTTTNWSTADSFCMSGTIPPLPNPAYQSDYDANWGIQIGVNGSEPPGATLAKDYTSVAITVTGKPSSGLRAELHVKGEPAGQTYCANLTSGTAIPFASFNQKCWDVGTSSEDPSLNLAASNVKNIDKVGIQVSSTEAEIKVEKLCLTGISFK